MSCQICHVLTQSEGKCKKRKCPLMCYRSDELVPKLPAMMHYRQEEVEEVVGFSRKLPRSQLHFKSRNRLQLCSPLCFLCNLSAGLIDPIHLTRATTRGKQSAAGYSRKVNGRNLKSIVEYDVTISDNLTCTQSTAHRSPGPRTSLYFYKTDELWVP